MLWSSSNAVTITTTTTTIIIINKKPSFQRLIIIIIIIIIIIVITTCNTAILRRLRLGYPRAPYVEGFFKASRRLNTAYYNNNLPKNDVQLVHIMPPKIHG